MANKKDVQNSPQKTNNFMFSLNITFLADYTRFYLINAHHAEIPGPETAAPECGDEYACRKIRAECKQVVSLAYFHTDGMDDGTKNACKNKCKNNVFCA